MSSDAQTEKQADPIDVQSPQETPQEIGTAIEAPEDDAANSTASPVLRGWRLYTVQFSLCLALFLGAIDSSIVATALVTIGRVFDNFVLLQWIVLAYLLTYLGFALIFSRISDVMGRKWTSIAAVLILTASSLGAGLSQTLTQVIAFRALQGLGGSGVYSLPLTVLPEITPAEKFPLMSGIAGITFTCSAVLGPTLGGVITTQSTWRWIFLFNLPCGSFIIALMLVAWPQTRTVGKISWRQLDLIGCLLCVAVSVLLVFALQQAGAGVYAWSSPIIIASLTVAAVAAIALWFWIWYLSSEVRVVAPLFPARIVLNRVIVASIVVSTLTGYVLYTVLIELAERFQIVNGKTSQTAGIALLPFLGAAAFGSFLGGYLSSGKGNRSFYTLTGTSAFMLLGSGLLSTVGHSATIPHYLYGYEVLLGFGLGGSLVSAIVVIKLNASEEDAASAQGLMSQSRVLGGNIGLAVATIIFNSHLTSDLAGILTPQQISDCRRSLNVIATFTPREAAAVAGSFANAFKSQMQVCMGVAAASLVVCFFGWQRHPPTFVELEKKKKAESRGETSGFVSTEA